MIMKILFMYSLAAKLSCFYQVAEVVDEACHCAMLESFSARSVTKLHFTQALRKVKPNTTVEEIRWYEEYNTRHSH